jgi:glutathione S-transferase
MKLYYSLNSNPRVAVATARYLNSPVEFIRANPRHPDHEEAFRPINPNALVPVLAEEGRPNLWEADAIACRLSVIAGSDFWPTDAGRLPELIRWLSWSSTHFNAAAGALYFEYVVVPQIFTRGPDEAVVGEALESLARLMPILDDALAGRSWLVGDQLSYADFRVATVLPFEQAQLPLAGYANVLNWRDRLREIDAWRAPFEGLAG